MKTRNIELPEILLLNLKASIKPEWLDASVLFCSFLYKKAERKGEPSLFGYNLCSSVLKQLFGTRHYKKHVIQPLLDLEIVTSPKRWSSGNYARSYKLNPYFLIADNKNLTKASVSLVSTKASTTSQGKNKTHKADLLWFKRNDQTALVEYGNVKRIWKALKYSFSDMVFSSGDRNGRVYHSMNQLPKAKSQAHLKSLFPKSSDLDIVNAWFSFDWFLYNKTGTGEDADTYVFPNNSRTSESIVNQALFSSSQKATNSPPVPPTPDHKTGLRILLSHPGKRLITKKNQKELTLAKEWLQEEYPDFFAWIQVKRQDPKNPLWKLNQRFEAILLRKHVYAKMPSGVLWFSKGDGFWCEDGELAKKLLQEAIQELSLENVIAWKDKLLPAALTSSPEPVSTPEYVQAPKTLPEPSQEQHQGYFKPLKDILLSRLKASQQTITERSQL